MVEEVLKNANTVLRRNEIMRRVKNKPQRQTLNTVLEYLEESGKIVEGSKGILWTYNPSKKLAELRKDALRFQSL